MKWLALLLCLITTPAWADQRSIGKLGIDSKITLLDGTGIDIAQVEFNGRSAKAGYDLPIYSASNTRPTDVWWTHGNIQDPPCTGQFGCATVDAHATEVVGVIIADTTAGEKYEGVAPKATLHSIGFAQGDEELIFLALNRAATISPEVRAINSSFGGIPTGIEVLNGRSRWTQFVDWSARQHDVLYVQSWLNSDKPAYTLPTDEYNGITVAALRTEENPDIGKSYDRWSEFNEEVTNDNDAVGDRTSIDILAPGHTLDILSTNDVPKINIPGDPSFAKYKAFGTSYAAPHVTGAVALLQQWAKARIDEGTDPTWNSDAQQHEVMKAVLLNSADKIAGVGASTKTICNTPGGECNDWRTTPAYTDPSTPLDSKLGAGALNVRGALSQFRHGEQNPGPVEDIGWNYNIIGSGGELPYVLTSPLLAGEWVTATLAWDRMVSHTGGATTWQYGAQFDTYAEDKKMNDLDLILVDIDTGSTIDGSISGEMNLEHIFFQITTPGNYALVVHHTGLGIGDNQKYALAWWVGNALAPWDYNGNGATDAGDYENWRGAFGVTDAADYVMWRNAIAAGSGSLAAVPEPSATSLIFLNVLLFLNQSGRPRGRKS